MTVTFRVNLRNNDLTIYRMKLIYWKGFAGLNSVNKQKVSHHKHLTF